MSDEEVLEKLLEFGEYLTKGTIMQDMFRWILWMCVKGLAWIVEALENITDTILGLKLFYNHPEFVEFIDRFQPVLVILFAFNILYIGYLMIFQKKFNREGVFTNLVMALIIIVLLGSGMQKADRFTNEAINAINYSGSDGGQIASKVITDNIIDISLYDLDGWESPDLENNNNIQSEYATDININSYLTSGSQINAEKELTSKGEKILGNKIETLGDGSRKVIELEDGNWISDITQEYYYRYTVDWINMIGTLLVMGFVLVTIAVKLAKLFFELAFNYVLAGFVAPTDMHSGQKMKQVIQNILNIFLVTIMVFLSMKVYIIGTEWIGETFDGFVYLIAMIGFAAAVVDGPNIVERLFGIDAGLKSGWGALAGTYALAKGAGGAAMSAGNVANKTKNAIGSVGSKSAVAAGGASGVVGGLMSKDSPSNESETNQSTSQPNQSNHENGQEHQGMNEQNTTGSENEVAAGMEESSQTGEHAPSIHDEMNESESEEGNGGKGSNSPTSLHDEMKQKGYAGGQSNKAKGKNSDGQSAQQGNKPPSEVGGTSNENLSSVSDSEGQRVASAPGDSPDASETESASSISSNGAMGHATSSTPNVSGGAQVDQTAPRPATGGTTTRGESSQGPAAQEGSSSTPNVSGGAQVDQTAPRPATGGTTTRGESSQGPAAQEGSSSTSNVSGGSQVDQTAPRPATGGTTTRGESSQGPAAQEGSSSTSNVSGGSQVDQTAPRPATGGTATGGESSQRPAAQEGSSSTSNVSGGSQVDQTAPRPATRGTATGGESSQRPAAQEGSSSTSNVSGGSQVDQTAPRPATRGTATGGGSSQGPSPASESYTNGEEAKTGPVSQQRSSTNTTERKGTSPSPQTLNSSDRGAGGSTPNRGGSSSGSGSSTIEQSRSNTTHVTKDISSDSGQGEVINDNNHEVVEERHIGQVVRDKVHRRVNDSQTVQNTKQSYQIGRNTGKAVRRNFKKQVKKFKE